MANRVKEVEKSATPRVAHLIVGLSQGGAEQSLKRLVTTSTDQHWVLCIGGPTPISRNIADSGVDVFHFKPWNLLAITKLLRKLGPDIVQGWMYYGNFLASLCTWLGRGKWQTVWNIRNAYSLAEMSFKIRTVVRLSRWLPKDLVISNSFSGLERLNLTGKVIDNGINVEKYHPDADARAKHRADLGVGDEIRLVALVSRYHVNKGLMEFLSLRKHLSAEHKLVLIGRGMSPDNLQLLRLAEQAGVDLSSSGIICLGERLDLDQLYSALDLLVVASYHEGSPNAMLEAMACGVTVVGTDVGDVARIIDDPNRVCESRDAEGLRAVVSHGLQHLGEFSTRDRQRIVEEFDSRRFVAAYADVYRQLLSTAESIA